MDTIFKNDVRLAFSMLFTDFTGILLYAKDVNGSTFSIKIDKDMHITKEVICDFNGIVFNIPGKCSWTIFKVNF